MQLAKHKRIRDRKAIQAARKNYCEYCGAYADIEPHTCSRLELVAATCHTIWCSFAQGVTLAFMQERLNAKNFLQSSRNAKG